MSLVGSYKREVWEKWVFSGLGVLTVVYCLAVLAFVATNPDIGLRILIYEDRDGDLGPRPGLTIRHIVRSGEDVDPWFTPQPGDRVISIARKPASSFLHFAQRIVELRHAQVGYGGHLHAGGDLQVSQVSGEEVLPEIVELDGRLLVEVKYLHHGEVVRGWLALESLPLEEVLLTFVWFLLQFGIFAVGALAFWKRPFDRQARVFYAMCLVTLVGFVGGYHWWMIAGSLWLTVPFIK